MNRPRTKRLPALGQPVAASPEQRGSKAGTIGRRSGGPGWGGSRAALPGSQGGNVSQLPRSPMPWLCAMERTLARFGPKHRSEFVSKRSARRSHRPGVSDRSEQQTSACALRPEVEDPSLAHQPDGAAAEPLAVGPALLQHHNRRAQVRETGRVRRRRRPARRGRTLDIEIGAWRWIRDPQDFRGVENG